LFISTKGHTNLGPMLKKSPKNILKLGVIWSVDKPLKMFLENVV
jgi:hypothetical protein